jgi:NADH-quinone oxidoreductase subunit M
VAFAAASTMIVGAAYTLWMYKRVIFGPVTNHHVAEMTDINGREFLILTLLAIGTMVMGVYPLPFTDVMHSSVNELLRHVAVSKIQ